MPHELDALLHNFKSLIITGNTEPVEVNATTPEYIELQEAFNEFVRLYNEMNTMAVDLASGNLFEPIPRKNRMADQLKNLHAQILHLTWQAQQVARGDYTQNVDFMGDFSDAFNSMIQQLQDREEHLIRNHEILLNILENMPYAVIAVGKDTKETLFENTAYKKWMGDGFFHEKCTKDTCVLIESLINYGEDYAGEKDEWEISCPKEECYFIVNTNKIIWTNGQTAYLHTLQDFSQYRAAEQELRAVAFSDEVTGVGNRFSATSYIDDLLEENAEFHLVFLDMDGLKDINDTHGHSEGDEAIKNLANSLRSSLRGSDQVFRLGGDEFLVVMQGVDSSLANQIILRIRNRLYDETKKNSYAISFSYGVHSRYKDDLETRDEILRLADIEMYKNKRRRKKERR